MNWMEDTLLNSCLEDLRTMPLKQILETRYKKSKALLLIIELLRLSPWIPLKKMIFKQLDNVTVKYPHKIQRSKKHQLFTRPLSKNYKIVYNKRQMIDHFKTLPFGY